LLGDRGYGPEDDQFRCRIREWLTANLTGRFAVLLGAGGTGGTTGLAPSGWPGTGTSRRPAGTCSSSRHPWRSV